MIVDTAGTEIIEDATVEDGDRRMWSVTTIIDAVSKGEGLMVWACRKAAACAVDQTDQWLMRLDADGRDEAVKWIANARNRSEFDQLPDKDLGTVGHSLCERYALTGERPSVEYVEQLVRSMGGVGFRDDAVRAEMALCGVFLDHFERWCDDFQPVWEAAEFVVYSPTYGYAGTADGIELLPGGADRDPMRVLNDFKFTRNAWTGGQKPKPKTPYAETVLQLAAYRNAELAAGTVARRYSYYRRRYYLLSQAEQALAIPMPEVDGTICTLITPEGCTAHPMRVDRDAHEAFLFCLEVARWQYQTSKGAVGAALVAPRGVEQ